jgi:hypothetical protein
MKGTTMETPKTPHLNKVAKAFATLKPVFNFPPTETTVMTLSQLDFIQLVITAKMAGWNLQENSDALSFAIFKRYPDGDDTLILFKENGEHLVGWTGYRVEIENYAELLAWVSNR